ncbi:hypothetical protein MOQ_000732 [Trypanosoma cruzi marinkellei]|uniref:MSP domain-containing protein n=1 Tax=Trypanosoma cruzi marinkellei TaxID=85056 RepID=K2PDP4_TRYCR|nr:hypothetical protein MOQ_000732 [Trypanosoma cruzi marinkellei]
MTLVASCGGIYFPETPVENILTLTWQLKESNEPTMPYGSVVFKVKSTSPKLFYVHPRYGVLLVSDSFGQSRNPCRTQVTFGLRPATTEVLSEEATTTTTTAAAAAAATTVTTTPPRSTTSIGVGNNYHERIVIEYIYISGDRAIYDRLSQGLATENRLSEVVRGVWDLLTGGTLQATRGTPITLKVYMDCVMKESEEEKEENEKETKKRKGEDGTMVVVVVPPTAKLVPPTLREQLLLNRMSTSHAREISMSSAAVSTSEKHIRSVGSNELRALKLGIDALRNEREMASSAVPVIKDDTYNKNNNNNNSSSNSNSNSNNNKNRNIPHSQVDHIETDILMRMPKLDNVTTKGFKNGVPLFMVLVAMFFTYVITMLLWRTI